MFARWRAKQRLRDILLVKQLNNQMAIMMALHLILQKFNLNKEELYCLQTLKDFYKTTQTRVNAFTDILEQEMINGK